MHSGKYYVFLAALHLAACHVLNIKNLCFYREDLVKIPFCDSFSIFSFHLQIIMSEKKLSQ